MNNFRGKIIHYRPVQLENIPEDKKLKWRKAEIMEYKINKLHIRVYEPLDEHGIIEILEDEFEFYYEILDIYGNHVRLWNK